MHRRQLAVIALLVALPLFVFPVVSPPPEPEPRLSAHVTEIGSGVSEDEFTVYNYTNLSTPARDLFDEANGVSTYVAVPASDAPDRFLAIADNEHSSSALVVREGRYFSLDLDVEHPDPSAGALLSRAVPFVLAVVLGCAGGYALVNSGE